MSTSKGPWARPRVTIGLAGRLLAMAVAAVALSISQTSTGIAQVNLPGWQATRWGMTEAQVRKTVEGAGLRIAVPDKGEDRWSGPDEVSSYAPFMSHMSVGGDDYAVFFLFADDTHRLSGVSLTGKSVGSFLEKRRATVSRLLIEKYGEPTKKRELLGWEIWLVGATTIELQTLPTLGSISLHYRPTKRAQRPNDREKL
jgi:hypothetical protein